ncbi:hypothetical protein TGAM01_v211094 [Trichoderma gamsii]|uniref:Uncharacterized protein n=1 Tax=Trichoderma gamsii TaxID=398673 RepID=A0A2P4Z6X6_9HYPO|nr:hypothetical protein TGAM01_v211094 [Trichoderma gamsii]PON20034.1 hypothetical protein TGAM01_v211094 [Trichoderma gamsii]
MSATPPPSYREQVELKASANDAKDFLSVYSDCSTTQAVPIPLGQSSRMTRHSIKSAIWSFMKGDIYYKHHPAFTQDRYFNAMMKDQRISN